MVRETQKVIQSLQLIISHQILPYSHAKSIWRFSLTCFRLFWALWYLGNLCPNRAQIAQIMARETQQVIKSLEFIISHQVRPYLSVMTIWRLSSTCSRLFGALVQFWKLGPKRAQIPEINVRETGSHPKSSSHNFTSSEALVKCDNNLMV